MNTRRDQTIDAFLAASPDALFAIDGEGGVTFWNMAAARMFGLSPSDMAGRPLAMIVPQDRLAEHQAHLAQIARGDPVPLTETQRLNRNGTRVDVAITLMPMRDADGQVVGAAGIARDIGPELRRRREAARDTRLYQSLTVVNQAIMRSRSRQELFDNVCAILVDHGDFHAAYILMHDDATKRIVPVASAGSGAKMAAAAGQYLEIYSDNRPGGQGPGGKAFRTGQPVVCNDIAADPTTRYIWEVAREAGPASLADLPIFMDGKPVGLMIVNSAEKDYFQAARVSLLHKVAGDISFALELMSRDAARREAEDLARAEQAFGDAMINAMPGIVYFYDTDGRFVRWNRNFEIVAEYDAAEIAHMHPLDFFPPEEKELVAERIKNVFVTGEAAVEAHFLTKSGRRIPYYFTGRRVEMNAQVYLIGVGVDVSELRAAVETARQSEQRYRALFEHAPDGILIGTQDHFTDTNDSMCRMLGTTRDQIIGRKAADFVATDDLSRLRVAMQHFDQGQNYSAQWQLKRSDGTFFPADVIATRLPDGNIMSLARDVSDREAAAAALRDLMHSLETRVADRTRDLASALDRAEKADRIKSAFLANMSHELRTPLNSIIGFTGIILQGLAGPLNPEQHKQLGMVRNSARHLLDLINDVLDISKIEAGQLSVQSDAFDLRDCIDRVTEQVAPSAARKGLRFDVQMGQLPDRIIADRRRLQQILINLLSNAVKFTETGAVTLTVDIARPDDAKNGRAQNLPQIRFTVSDTGIGIRPDDLASLFQPFRQLDSGLSRQHEGTGLGLAISRRLAQLLGGDLTATSTPGQGSAFTAAIPLREGMPV